MTPSLDGVALRKAPGPGVLKELLLTGPGLRRPARLQRDGAIQCPAVVSFEPSPQKVLVTPFDGYSFCRDARIAYPPSAVCTTFFTSLNVVLGSTRSRMSVP